MTKPIEGWVFCDEHDEPLAMKTMVGGNIRERFSVAKELLEGDTKERYRPVKITFTDEPDDDAADAADVIRRKEGERIWELMVDYVSGEVEGTIRRAIFGEEK